MKKEKETLKLIDINGKALETEPEYPIVVDGQIVFKLTILSENEYTIESLPNITNDLVVLLLAKDISTKWKADIVMAKKNKIAVGIAKSFFDDRINKLNSSIFSLGTIANDLFSTLVDKCKVENNSKLK